MKILHIIPSLAQGGAERALLSYLEIHDIELKHNSILILFNQRFYIRGGIYKNFKGKVITLFSSKVCREFLLMRDMFKNPPQVIVCWMYHSMIVGCILGLFFRLAGKRVNIYWNFRQNFMGWHNEKLLTRLVIFFLRFFISNTAGLIFNSQSSRKTHEKIGFLHNRVLVLPNQFDTQRFVRASDRQTKSIKTSLGLWQETKTICHVGRFHPVKNHRLFLEIISSLLRTEIGSNFQVALLGEGVDRENISFYKLLEEVDLVDDPRVLCYGAQTNVELFLGVSDIYVQTSQSESFPNALCEAMLCENVIVATDVGATRELLGSRNNIAGTARRSEIKKGILWALSLDPDTRKKIGHMNRKSVVRINTEVQSQNRFSKFLSGMEKS